TANASVIALALFDLFLCSAHARTLKTPDEIYGPLFRAVQMERVFPDSKSFVDAIPRQDPLEIMALYRAQSNLSGFDLKLFVAQHFDLPRNNQNSYISEPNEDVIEHIDRLWDYLNHQPSQQTKNARSSLLPLHYPYIVPGGRFREIYYWDSYFTMH